MSRYTKTTTRGGFVVEDTYDSSNKLISTRIVGRSGETEQKKDYSIIDWTKLLEGLGIDVVSEKKYGGKVSTRKASSSTEKP